MILKKTQKIKYIMFLIVLKKKLNKNLYISYKIVFFVFAVVLYFFRDSEFKTFVDFFESSVSWAEKNLVLF